MKGRAAIAGLVLLAGVATASAAQAYTLPPPNPAYSGELGDFAVYSAPFLNLFFFGDQKGGGMGLSYIVDSSPGRIKDFLVVGTAPAAARDNTDVLGGTGKGDNAYETPVPGGSANWDTNKPPFCGAITASCLTSPDPGGLAAEFTGDAQGTWDVQLSALNTFLAGGDLVFFFNQNQTGTQQDIWAWGMVSLVDNEGKLPKLNFEFNNDTSGVFAFTSDGVLSPAYKNPSDIGEFVFSPGQVCIDPTPPVPVVVPCTGTKSDIVINHNLGAENASYALFAPEMNAILESPGFGGYDVMQIRFAFGDSNNGYEQVFIMAQVETPQIPEPAALVLLGSGLLGLGALAWRRRRRLDT